MVPLPLCTSTESEPTVGFPLAPLQLRVPAPTLAFGQNCQLSTVVSNDQTLRDPDAEVHKGGGAASGPAKINRLLTQDSGLTSAECFVVCLRAAAKFLAQYDKDEWRDMIKHASELLSQHAALYKQSSDDSAYANKNSRPVSARRFWWSWR